MIGLGIVVTFLILALVAPLLAPMEYAYNDGEKNSPPGIKPLVLTNQSALDISGPSWNRTEWLAREDELYAYSATVGNVLLLRRFPFEIYGAPIEFVGVALQVNSSQGEPGSVVDIALSWDNGTSWSASQRSPLRFSDDDDAWFLLDYTNATGWTAAKLNATNFIVRVTHSLQPPFTSAGSVGVDVLRLVVRFRGDHHFLGTTADGEDVLTGLLLGTQISIRIGIIVVAVATIIGSLLGAISGYYGGAIDELIMRITDVFLAIPGLILAMAVAAALGRNLDNVVYALIIVYWPAYTRLVRGQALSVRENLYVEAARATGASELRVVTRHVLPNTLAPILVQSSLDIGSVVLVAAGLSFLGLGAQPGTPEWGLMVSRGFTFFPNVNWWQVSFSGLMIFLFVLGFNLLGDGARDILDPRLRR
jgi:peptide/nickel transport system permease protein